MKVNLKTVKSKKTIVVTALLTLSLGVAFGCPAANHTTIIVASKITSGTKFVKLVKAVLEKVKVQRALAVPLSPQRFIGLHFLACIALEVATGVLITKVTKYRAILTTVQETCDQVKNTIP
jgi:hypothetical protein